MSSKKFKPKHNLNQGVERRPCKFQRELSTNDPLPGGLVRVLAYDKKREWMGEFSMTTKQAIDLFGKQAKFYAMAWRHPATGKLHIDKFLPPQDW